MSKKHPLNVMIPITNIECFKALVEGSGKPVTTVSGEVYGGNSSFLSQCYGDHGKKAIKLGRAMMLEKAYPKMKVERYSGHKVTDEEWRLFTEWVEHEKEKAERPRRTEPTEERQISIEEYATSISAEEPKEERPLTREDIARVFKGEDSELERWIYGIYQALRDKYEGEKNRISRFANTYYGKEAMR